MELHDYQLFTAPMLDEESREETSHKFANLSQYEGQRWLLTFNHYSRKTHLNVVLSSLMVITMFLSFSWYIHSNLLTFALIPILAEVLLDCLSLYLYYTYPKVFRAEKIPYSTILKIEVATILVKVTVIGIIVGANSSAWVLSMSPVLLLACFLSEIGTEYYRKYDELYDSVFSLVSMLTVIMLYAKLSGLLVMTLESVFLVYRLIAWLTAIVFVLHLTFLLVMIASELLYKKGYITIKKGLLNISLSFNYFFYTLTYFCAVDYSLGREEVFGCSMEAVIYIACTYLAVHCLIVLVYHKELDTSSTWKTPNQDQVVEFKDLTYMISLIKSTPTYFVAPGRDSIPNQNHCSARTQDHLYSEQDECLICCVGLANCIVFDCMHTGACRECCIQELRRTNKCMICRRPVSKIAVTVQVSDTEYKVVEEITLQPEVEENGNAN